MYNENSVIRREISADKVQRFSSVRQNNIPIIFWMDPDTIFLMHGTREEHRLGQYRWFAQPENKGITNKHIWLETKKPVKFGRYRELFVPLLYKTPDHLR